jgi:hypothetical protein
VARFLAVDRQLLILQKFLAYALHFRINLKNVLVFEMLYLAAGDEDALI